MPRRPRIHVPGGIYHVIARGNARRDIFIDHDDRNHWQRLIAEGIQLHEHRIHAFCWMSNHIHIAIQASRRPLAGFMGSILSRYARRFNQKTGRSGHLFERRYRAILVQRENYLLELVRYIHCNPERAGITDVLGEYPWSSHHAYIGRSRPPWLTTDVVLSLFGSERQTATRRYLDFMGETQLPEVCELLRGGLSDDNRALGDDAWRESTYGDSMPPPITDTLESLVERACRLYVVTEEELSSPSRVRKFSRIRSEIALLASEKDIATVTEVARRFGRSTSVISRSINRLRAHSK